VEGRRAVKGQEGERTRGGGERGAKKIKSRRCHQEGRWETEEDGLGSNRKL